MTPTDRTLLRARAKRAFSPKFRKQLAEATFEWAWTLGKKVHWKLSLTCACPEGTLHVRVLGSPCGLTGPTAQAMQTLSGFQRKQHTDFQLAFDVGTDVGTPEAALGLLYRDRAGRNDWGITGLVEYYNCGGRKWR